MSEELKAFLDQMIRKDFKEELEAGAAAATAAINEEKKAAIARAEKAEAKVAEQKEKVQKLELENIRLKEQLKAFYLHNQNNPGEIENLL